jgi:hypothetical protein
MFQSMPAVHHHQHGAGRCHCCGIHSWVELAQTIVMKQRGNFTEDNGKRGHYILPQSNFKWFFGWAGAHISDAIILDI